MGGFNAQSFGLTVDPFGGGPLVIKLLVEVGVAVKANSHPAPGFDVDMFDTTVALGKLFVVTIGPSELRKQERTAQELSLVTAGMVIRVRGRHLQASRAEMKTTAPQVRFRVATQVEREAARPPISAKGL